MKKNNIKLFTWRVYTGKFNIDTTKEWLNIPIMDRTMILGISTPKGWKCKRKGCKTKIKHSHTTWQEKKM